MDDEVDEKESESKFDSADVQDLSDPEVAARIGNRAVKTVNKPSSKFSSSSLFSASHRHHHHQDHHNFQEDHHHKKDLHHHQHLLNDIFKLKINSASSY